MGLALHESFGSIVAQVVEVSVLPQKIKVHRVWCVIDCGTAVNPDLIAQQMEGSVAFALSAALYGRINGAKDGFNKAISTITQYCACLTCPR